MSFTGRDEDIDDDSRHRRRYTLSHLAQDVKAQTGAFEPLRDWFPLSAAGAFADVTDLIQGPAAEWGTMKCGCHPNCGVGAALMVSKKTKEWAPLTKFLAADRLLAGREGHRRRRPRPGDDQGDDRVEPAAQLQAVPGARRD